MPTALLPPLKSSALSSCVERAPALHNEIASLSLSPESQVVGDLAQFMVQNELTEKELVDRAETLDFPSRCI